MAKLKDFFTEIDLSTGRFFSSFRDASGNLESRTGTVDEYGNVFFDEDYAGLILLIIILVIGIPTLSYTLHALLNCAFVIASIPHIVSLLAKGHGLGLQPLLIWLGVPLAISILASLTRRFRFSWLVRLYPLWALASGIGLMVYHAQVLGNTTYNLLPIPADLSLFAGKFAVDLHVVIYVYTASIAISFIPGFLSFSSSHFYTASCTARTILVISILVHPVMKLFGYEHPMTPEDIYSGMEHLTSALLLTRDDMYDWCTKLSAFAQKFNGWHLFFIGVAAAIVISVVIRIIAALMHRDK